MEMPFGRLQTQRVCDRCQGKGKLLVSCGDCEEGLKNEEKNFTINLFPEMTNGYKITFSGEGNQEVDKVAGDIIIMVAFQTHSQFKLSENDLIYQQKITLKEALCGHDFTIVHPSGRNLRIIGNEVLHKDITKQIRGEGLHPGGNLNINFDIIFPESLTDEQRKGIKMFL
jgi:DnaJ-class molecular chaperone